MPVCIITPIRIIRVLELWVKEDLFLFQRVRKMGGCQGEGKDRNKICVCVCFGCGRENERGNMSECGGRRGNERILYIFLYLSFPCYLPYDFLIHQNAGKIMFWAK